MASAIFLDRDGTMIRQDGYLTRPDQLELLPGVAGGIAALRELGYLIIVVTNQSAIARGMLTEPELQQIHSLMEDCLRSEGALLDDILYCPYHPDGVIEGFRRESELRKPAAGMLLEAAARHRIELRSSVMVGDTPRDRDAGRAAGCITVRLADRPDPEADFTARNFSEAVDWIRDLATGSSL